MNERTKTGLEILRSAVLLGILGNVLLRQTPWGLNAFLFVTAFAAALVILTRRRRPELLTATNLALYGAMVFFASMFLIRDSIELRIYDTFAILVIMGVLLLANFGVKARISGAFHYAIGFVWSGISSLLAPFVLLGADIDWKAMPGNRISRHLFSVLRGLAVALPLVLIFGALFMAADAAFEGMVNRAINFELETVVSHVILTSVLAWLTAGYFRGSLVAPFVPKAEPAATSVSNDQANQPEASSFVEKVTAEPVDDLVSLPNNATILQHINRSDPPNSSEQTAAPDAKIRNWQDIDSSRIPNVFTLGTVETVIILGLVNLLFLSFVIVQIPYLFGGMELVQNTPDFKLAEYARRGFGELVAVAALVLPILLFSHWLLRKDKPVNEKIYRVFAGIQILLLFVIMASAAQRLILLTGNLGYGLTTVRLYPMIFMIWLAIVFVWFAATVLRGSRQYFAWGALWSALFVLGATHVLNPDEFIVRTNVRLMQEGREFDPTYVVNLSDDAIPALVDSLPAMRFEHQCTIKSKLSQRRIFAEAENDIRTWNWSRYTAYQYLAAANGFPGAEECLDFKRPTLGFD